MAPNNCCCDDMAAVTQSSVMKFYEKLHYLLVKFAFVEVENKGD